MLRIPSSGSCQSHIRETRGYVQIYLRKTTLPPLRRVSRLFHPGKVRHPFRLRLGGLELLLWLLHDEPGQNFKLGLAVDIEESHTFVDGLWLLGLLLRLLQVCGTLTIICQILPLIRATMVCRLLLRLLRGRGVGTLFFARRLFWDHLLLLLRAIWSRGLTLALPLSFGRGLPAWC